MCPASMWMVSGQRCVSTYIIRGVATEYRRIFADRVVTAFPPEVPWPDDLSVPRSQYGSIVLAMPANLQKLIGQVALEHGKTGILQFVGTSKARQAMARMEEEVEDGSSVVILSLAGEVERVMSVAVLHLMRDGSDADGEFVLVLLAEWQESQAAPAVQLPATKRLQGESAEKALERLLTTDLAPLGESLEMRGDEREIYEEYSSRMQVRTVYRRRIFFARLASPMHAPICQAGRIDLGRSSTRNSSQSWWSSGESSQRNSSSSDFGPLSSINDFGARPSLTNVRNSRTSFPGRIRPMSPAEIFEGASVHFIGSDTKGVSEIGLGVRTRWIVGSLPTKLAVKRARREPSWHTKQQS